MPQYPIAPNRESENFKRLFFACCKPFLTINTLSESEKAAPFVVAHNTKKGLQHSASNMKTAFKLSEW
jgi:hypothetical protein